MQKVFLLGSTGFVGKNISSELAKKYNVIELARSQFDFLNSNTFLEIDFSNSIIVDCINVNNGNAGEIINCNVNGFQMFIDFITQNHVNVKYLYFSSISVLSEEIKKQNIYVNSKFIAEKYLMHSGLIYHIVRLSYPIGKGENPNRLISRFIKSIKEKQTLSLSNIKINITPIKCIANDINSLVRFDGNRVTFFSSNVYLSLTEIVDKIGDLLNVKPNYTVTKSDNRFEPVSDNPINCSIDLISCLKDMI